MENGTHSIWVSEQIKELGHEVIVANVRELRADILLCGPQERQAATRRRSPSVCSARSQKILRPIAHRTVVQQRAADAVIALGCPGSPTTRRRELGARSGEALHIPPARLFHLLCEAMLGCAASRSG